MLPNASEEIAADDLQLGLVAEDEGPKYVTAGRKKVDIRSVAAVTDEILVDNVKLEKVILTYFNK